MDYSLIHSNAKAQKGTDPAKTITVLVLVLFLFSCFIRDASAQTTTVTSTAEAEVSLLCAITSNTLSATWTETGNETRDIYSLVAGSVRDNRNSVPKYANFNTSLVVGSSFSLVITPVQTNDGGTYECNVVSSNQSEDGRTVHSVEVEALPDPPVTIECDPVPAIVCPTTGLDRTSSEFLCTCTATGVYPERLEFTWENVDDSSASAKISRGILFDITATATVRPSSGNPVTCSLSGYINEAAQQSPTISAKDESSQFASPTCTLVVSEITADTVCSAVPLRCECNGLNAESEYSFYNGETVIGGPSNELTVNITQYSGSDYYCRVCNGIYYEEGSIGRKKINCPPLTSNTGLIIGIIAAVVVVIGLVAFLVWFFKCRGGGLNRVCATLK